MSNQPSSDDENEKQQSLANPSPVRSELLRKIYYPDTLYPDSYSFFADRRTRSMDTRSPSTSSNNAAPIARQAAIDIETTERPRTQPEKRNMSLDDQHGMELAQSPMIDRDHPESESERRRFDIKRYIPSALRSTDKTHPPAILLDTRFYTMKKTAMTLLCLLIIIMSNSVQLKHVLKQGSTHPFYSTQVFLGIISVMMCAAIGVILMYVMRIDINDQYKQHKLDYIDNCLICVLFILAIFNIFIAACS